jgi:hypothetical protein
LIERERRGTGIVRGAENRVSLALLAFVVVVVVGVMVLCDQ